MAAPLLTPLKRVSAETLARLPALPARDRLATFVVSGAGRFGALDYAVGDVLVCQDGAADADEVVLVATGFGRPRLGHKIGPRLYGDRGEPCHPMRWRSAGQVVAMYREGIEGWVLHLRQGCGAVQAPTPVHPPASQLGLFEKAA